ncbi:MAG: excinuclease ABC subunit C, partial [Deltaproteobacteria bacterium]|nr:excinuclease ABC subunit C [Deltaproteobacteria bacterium]
RSRKERFSDYFLVSGREESVRLDPHAPAFQLLARIRDEAHRFAITYHRKRRGKTALDSRLLSIPGIGEKRLKILFQTYPSLEAIREAPVEEIAALPAFNRKLAEELKTRLISEEREEGM